MMPRETRNCHRTMLASRVNPLFTVMGTPRLEESTDCTVTYITELGSERRRIKTMDDRGKSDAHTYIRKKSMKNAADRAKLVTRKVTYSSKSGHS